MNQPLQVSIITPSFNQARFIETTIRSVLAQDYPHIEYIVVDGGSDDGTAAILDRYSDRIDRIIREPDEGQSDAINKGFRLAGGDVIAWLNSDDYYFPGAVSTAVRAFEADTSLDLVYGDCTYTDEAGQFIKYFSEVRPFSQHVLLNRSNFIMQPTTFYRRAAAERVGFLRDELQYTMDWDFWCRLARAGCRFAYLPELLAANREYGSTKTVAGGPVRQREIMRINREHGNAALPLAAMSFRVGDALRRRGMDQNHFRLYRTLRRLKRTLYGEANVHPYGIEAYGDRLERAFRICLPWYAQTPRAVHVALRRAGGKAAEVMLTANHATCRQTIAPRQSKTVELPIEPDAFGHVIDLRGQWRGEGGWLRLESVEVRT